MNVLKAVNTPHHLGIEVSGDTEDFQTLYEALWNLAGDEDQWSELEEARLRILAVCYDLRHALQGHREVEVYDNGLTPGMMRTWGRIGPRENVRFAFKILYPEALFVTAALNDFLFIYTGPHGEAITSRAHADQMDLNIVYGRYFQTLVLRCAEEITSKSGFKRLRKALNTQFPWTYQYFSQYLDYLDDEFVQKRPERRGVILPTLVERMTSKGPEYQEIVNSILRYADEHGCTPDEVRFIDEIDWDNLVW
ncbi:DUF6904 family protein [Alicyclobacillus acidocaldarius]|nr:hypothetical protein [Alicyclobacillus acidocaldarius]